MSEKYYLEMVNKLFDTDIDSYPFEQKINIPTSQVMEIATSTISVKGTCEASYKIFVKRISESIKAASKR
jgi:hypothetical protein